MVGAVSRITKTDSSEITQDKTPHFLLNCCCDDLRAAYIPKVDTDHRLGCADNNKKEESSTRGDNHLR